MHLAANDVIEARWRHAIYDEWIAALSKNRPDLTRQSLEKVRDLMNLHARDALVEGFEPLIETLELPDSNDRHVLAAAIQANAKIIVTLNTKDFPTEILSAHEIEAQCPGDFLCALLQTSAPKVLSAIQGQRAQLRRPPRTVAEHLEILRLHGLPRFALELHNEQF